MEGPPNLPAPTCPPIGDAEVQCFLAEVGAATGASGAVLEVVCEQTGERRCYAWGAAAATVVHLDLGASAGFQLRLSCRDAPAVAPAMQNLLLQRLHGLVTAHALTHENRLLQRLLDGTGDPLLLFDGAGAILHANDAADRLLGQQTERSLAVAGAGGEQPLLAAVCAAVQECAADGHPRSLELALGDGSSMGCELRPVTAAPPITVAVWLRRERPAGTGALPRLAGSCHLSPREVEVVELLLEGRTTPQIADSLSISPHTVRDHLKSVYRKTATTSRSELLALLSRRPADR